MAVSQKLTLNQLENQGNNYQVNVLWTSAQTGASYNNVTRTAYLYYSVNGGEETVVTVKYTLPLRTEKVILNLTIVVPPAEEGTATLNVRTWMDTHISAGVVTLVEELELKPVESTMTAADAAIGTVIPVKIHSSSTEHTHSVRYEFGAKSGYLTETGGVSAEEIILAVTDIPFLLPESFYEEIPDARSGVCQLSCTTYAGDTQVGEPQQATFTVSADGSQCSPTVSGSVVDVNPQTLAITGNENQLIRYHSTALCTITPELKNYASVDKQWINGVELEQGSNEISIDKVEQEQVMFAVADSRGFRAEAAGAISLIPYRHLTMSASAERDDPTSGNATLRCSGLFYRGNFGDGTQNNTLTFQYKIGAGEFITAAADYSVGAPSVDSYSAALKLSGLSYQNTHTITVRVSDKLETVEKRLTLKKGVPVFDWGENDFKFNVPVTIEGEKNYAGKLLDVKGLLNAETLTVGGMPLNYVLYPVGGVFITYDPDADPNDIFGGAWESVNNSQILGDGYRWVRKA